MADLTLAGEVRPAPFSDALSERYLSYALSTIMSRSLPDVRDGLKPVHRRLLYAMRQLRLDPDQGFKKCARIVGDVMGKYHPHGDAAIYDALVRLAQEFAARYPLVDGQGNFGNVDGDNAAAMRYTEARMTAVAELLLEGIDEDAVGFRQTYDGENEEPIVLPANFPNLLANGAQGIAVGMATSIPPHNIGELCDSLVHLIGHPEARIDTLVRLVPGPDFPTGGILVEPRENIVEAYASGRGSFRLRARWEVEKLKGGIYQVVVTEIPYQVQKARLIERIAELLQQKKLALLADVRDESTDEVRLVLEPKSRNVDPAVLMETLFRQTELETRIGLNMNVLDGGLAPRVMNLREVLRAYLDHRHDVLVRRSKFRLGKIEERLEILEGFRIAYLNIDAVIRIIREEDDPKAKMMRKWKLTDNQVEAILNMRLRALRKLEEISIAEEHKKLSAERAEIKGLLRDESKRWKRLGEEVRALKAKFGPKSPLGKRRTEIGSAPEVEDVPLEAYVEREPITVICSDKGWIRSVKGHLADMADLKYKEGDRHRFAIHAETTDKLLVFATNGRFYTLTCDKLPGGRGFGEPLSLMIEFGNDQGLVHMRVYKADEKFIVAASDGRGFVVKAEDVLAQTRAGKQVLNVGGDVEAAACAPVSGDWVAVLGENRKLVLFKLDEVPEMSRGRGVILQKYKDGGLSDVKSFAMAEGLTCRTGDRTRTFSKVELGDWVGQRAQAGRLPPNGFPRSRKFD
ncbi:MAG TPA: DNA topoisomerase IV subunit A [Alphaproteobacteria bacterium]|nr:DNA topoisomerase IV subunit A [Alphaproteobacteria bacterium]